jgi:hypothetical protein
MIRVLLRAVDYALIGGVVSLLVFLLGHNFPISY